MVSAPTPPQGGIFHADPGPASCGWCSVGLGRRMQVGRLVASPAAASVLKWHCALDKQLDWAIRSRRSKPSVMAPPTYVISKAADPVFAVAAGLAAAATRITREGKEKGKTAQQTAEAGKRFVLE